MNALRIPCTRSVSIAMATYNGASFLEEQLNSILKQSRMPDELIISDDGSTDRTISICEQFAESAPFAVQIRQNSLGVGYARNFQSALSCCSGDLVFLSDQDDVWFSKKIERMTAEFDKDENSQVQLVIHDLEYCDSELSLVGERKIARIAKYRDVQKSYVTGMATAVRGSFLAKCLPIPEVAYDLAGHDGWLHKCANLVHGKKVIPDVLAFYRRHGANVTGARTLNAPRKVTAVDLTPRISPKHFSQTSVERLSTLAELYAAMLDRLSNDFDLADNGVKLHKEVESMRKRVEALSEPRLRRAISVYRLYMQGGYRYFSGIKSALKDVLFN